MLVTLEGLDGSGKTTVWEALQDTYTDATFTHEPTSTWYGETVEKSLRDEDADPLAELFLFTADHANHVNNVISPALDEEKLVISDRYSDSRYAYQAATIENRIQRPMEYIRGIHSPFTLPPKMTIYLDIDPNTGLERNGMTDKFEKIDYLAKVRGNYERLIEAEPERFVRIDATSSPEVVIEKVENSIEKLIEKA